MPFVLRKPHRRIGLSPAVCVLFGLFTAWPAATEAADGETAAESYPALRPFFAGATWKTPHLDDKSYRRWLTFIRPTRQELKWKNIRWHKSLSQAAAEARRLRRPILLWTMNGHPCGET